ncbi:MAG TPA: hypothetical protein VFZ42_03980 [Chitinophagaceae bacterium]
MKKLLLCVTFVVAIFTSETKAQVNVNINIGSQPVWGPIGYDRVDYYYLPDIETYYYVPTRQFIYFSGGNWVFAYGLPPAYRSYNLYSGYKVVVNRPKAYLYHDTYKIKYKKYKGNNSQAIIRNSNDPRYYVVKGHPKYKANGAVNKSVSKGKGGGNGKGKGKNR